MTPTLKDGDRIFVTTSPGELKRGDIVSFLFPKDTSKYYIKRIVGLPGETLEIREGKVFINNVELDETYVLGPYNTTKPTFPPKVIETDQYYVLGDNRDNSSDSRYWGTVSKELINGKFLMTYATEK